MPTTTPTLAVGQTITLTASWVDGAGNPIILPTGMSIHWYKDTDNVKLYHESGSPEVPATGTTGGVTGTPAGPVVHATGITPGPCNVQASPSDPSLQLWITCAITIVAATPSDGTIAVS